MSEYVGYQPTVIEIPFYVKGRSDFLQKINAVGFFPHSSHSVSLDVKSLYTSIPNAEGIKAVKNSLDNYPKPAVAT